MRQEVEKWRDQSIADLKPGKNSFTSEDWYVAVFLCHQSVEKALKAVILFEEGEVPRGHDLLDLSKKTHLPDSMLSNIRSLNPEYLTTRYPDMAVGTPADSYDEKIAKRHLTTAEEVSTWMKKTLER